MRNSKIRSREQTDWSTHTFPAPMQFMFVLCRRVCCISFSVSHPLGISICLFLAPEPVLTSLTSFIPTRASQYSGVVNTQAPLVCVVGQCGYAMYWCKHTHARLFQCVRFVDRKEILQDARKICEQLFSVCCKIFATVVWIYHRKINAGPNTELCWKFFVLETVLSALKVVYLQWLCVQLVRLIILRWFVYSVLGEIFNFGIWICAVAWSQVSNKVNISNMIHILLSNW